MKIFVKLDVKDFTNIHFFPMPLNLLWVLILQM